MSTRSAIAIEMPDHTVESCYCHSDGYPAYNGAFLNKYYNSAEMARTLVDSGGISSIDKCIGEKHGFDYDERRDACTFYNRDRGDEKEISTWPDRSSLVKNASDHYNAEYLYLFILAGEWLVYDIDHPDNGFVPVATHPDVVNSDYVK